MAFSYPNLFERLLANSVESELYFFEGTPCWEWTAKQKRRGYPQINLYRDGRTVTKHAHRVMAELVVGRPLHPDRETIEHRCEIPWCINFLHFAIVSRADNTSDAQSKRSGKPRRIFLPLVDLDLYFVDRFIRSLPVLKSDITEECPF